MKTELTLPGQKWRQTHQASIDGVLGAGVRRVESRGQQFFNRDKWPLRKLITVMCEWAGKNPGSTPDEYQIGYWVELANADYVDPGIVIAQTPDQLPLSTRDALVGGAYHEAWHTKYSRRTRLRVDEVRGQILSRWSRIDWAKLSGKLLEWSNIIEDIRIERVGCVDFPGALSRMEALQDLILRQEEEGLEKAREMKMPVNGKLHTVTCYFRDKGLGYDTPTQRRAFASYDADGIRFVEETLKPELDRAMALGPKDDNDSLWVAMDVLAKIVEEARKAPPQEEEKPSQGDGSKKKVWKKGDKAKLRSGPDKGKEILVTYASRPDRKTGEQRIEYSVLAGS